MRSAETRTETTFECDRCGYENITSTPGPLDHGKWPPGWYVIIGHEGADSSKSRRWEVCLACGDKFRAFMLEGRQPHDPDPNASLTTGRTK